MIIGHLDPWGKLRNKLEVLNYRIRITMPCLGDFGRSEVPLNRRHTINAMLACCFQKLYL